jgi:hypothetical protein
MKERMSMRRQRAATAISAREISKKLLVRAMKGLPYWDFWSSISSWPREILRALTERMAKVMTTPINRT